MRFKDRTDAGKILAKKLLAYKNNPDTIIIALPRGGVVIGFEVAQALNLPLDIVVPRKIGAPLNPEFAVGAVTEDGSAMLDPSLLALLKITEQDLVEIIAKEKEEAQRRLKTYRAGRAPLNLSNKIVLLVDDGIATGATMLAAIKSAQKREAQKIIVAVPVAPPDSIIKIKHALGKNSTNNNANAITDMIIVLHAPQDFGAISIFYDSFEQTTDKEVIALLEQTKK